MTNAVSSLYFPPAGDNWKELSPEDAGLDGEVLANAVKFAEENEATFWTRAIRDAMRLIILTSLVTHVVITVPTWSKPNAKASVIDIDAG